jgi:hypothetical protein
MANDEWRMANGDEGVGGRSVVRWKRSAGYAPSSQQRDQKSSNPTRILTQKLWYGIGYWHNIYHPNPEKEFCNRKNNYD